MKKFSALFILCLLFSTHASQAGSSVFDDAASFAVAKTRKGYDSLKDPPGTSRPKKIILIKNEPEIKNCAEKCTSCDTKTGECRKCIPGAQLKDNACTSCPDNAYCKGTLEFSCKKGYYSDESGCRAFKDAPANLVDRLVSGDLELIAP